METKNVSQEEWNKIVSQFEDLSLTQVWEYAEARAKLGPWNVVRHIFWHGDKIIGAAQGVVRTAPFFKKGLVWINRAPLWRKIGENGNLSLMKEMLLELRRYWVDERKMYLRIAPPLLENKENQIILENAKFIPCNSSFKWCSAIIDLANSEEYLYRGLRRKWRQYFRRLEEQNVSCELSFSSQDLSDLLLDYEALAIEKGFDTSSTHPNFVKELHKLIKDNKGMVIFIARKNELVLGRFLVAAYGNTCTAYIIGRNLPGKELHINHFLYWEAIKAMRRFGYRWFDVGGADPNRTAPGVLHFKEGLGGIPYKFIGEFEAYCNELIIWLVKIAIKYKRKYL